ncbi:MAG: SusD/RagB family nutrient-binding outer membrane lipoprotein [Bacteroidota bacterium]
MNRLKTWSRLAAAALLAVTFSACDDFGDLNTDPTQADQIDPNFKLTNIQLRISGERYENWRTNLIYSATMLQHMAALPTYWTGDKYLLRTDYAASMWERYYPNISRNIEDLMVQVCEAPEDANLCAITRITRVVMYHRLTDLYGDIPYSEAGKGVTEGIVTPVYDTQEAIYADMLNELQEAGAQLDASLPSFGGGDLLYGGNVDQWRKFANSMMLRLGMRLSEVDPTTAQTWVERAITGGVMESNADIAFVPHDANAWRNGVGEVFLADGNQHMSQTFVDWLEDGGDPRLNVFGSVPVAGAAVVGMPNGFDAVTIADHPTWIACEGDPEPSPCGTATYMDVNPAIVGVDDPMFLQTYAEVELLLAEAAIRGWGASGANGHYDAGVRAAMQHLSLYGDGAAIADDAIDAYLAADPFDESDANALEQIANQYWAATFLNEYETFANWRRTGFPTLTPTNYPGNVTGGTIPRRMLYSPGESITNEANYNEAVSRQGPDELTTRVWWDVN